VGNYQSGSLPNPGLPVFLGVRWYCIRGRVPDPLPRELCRNGGGHIKWNKVPCFTFCWCIRFCEVFTVVWRPVLFFRYSFIIHMNDLQLFCEKKVSVYFCETAEIEWIEKNYEWLSWLFTFEGLSTSFTKVNARTLGKIGYLGDRYINSFMSTQRSAVVSYEKSWNQYWIRTASPAGKVPSQIAFNDFAKPQSRSPIQQERCQRKEVDCIQSLSFIPFKNHLLPLLSQIFVKIPFICPLWWMSSPFHFSSCFRFVHWPPVPLTVIFSCCSLNFETVFSVKLRPEILANKLDLSINSAQNEFKKILREN
jgi:hypothetical protein